MCMESNLDRVLAELDKSVYDINLALDDRISIRLKQESNDSFPTHDLRIKTDATVYVIPIHSSIFSLKSYADSLNKGGIEIIIGSADENAEKSKSLSGGRYVFIEPTSEVKMVEEELALLQERAQQGIERYTASQFDARLQYVEAMCEFMDSDMRDLVVSNLDEAANADRDLIAKFDKKAEDVERYETFRDISKQLKFWGKVTNFISFGGVGRFIGKQVHEIAERNLAWRVLGDASKGMSRAFEEDAKYLAEIGNDLSEELNLVASFYGNMAYQAEYGQRRMKNLFDRASSLYSAFTDVKTPDLETMGQSIYNKISTLKLKMSPNQAE